MPAHRVPPAPPSVSAVEQRRSSPAGSAAASLAAVALGVLAACGAERQEPGPGICPDGQRTCDEPRPAPSDAVAVPDSVRPEPGPLSERFRALSQELVAARVQSPEELALSHAVEHVAELGFSPGEAEFLDRIQASALSLTQAELAALQRGGFVISKRQTFPTFLRGYAAIYMEHLPVYVTADAILDALHRSYDEILLMLESRVLQGELRAMLGEMTAALGSSGASESVKADAKLYLDVAAALLEGRAPTGGDPRVAEWVAQAMAAEGMIGARLFDTDRLVDTSQFTPRGHYTEGLENYFRAMMWLGRIDLRLVETLTDGSQVFRRSQYEATLALWEAMQGSAGERWQRIDSVVRAFVGESDNMVPAQVGQLVEALGGLEAARSASDEQVLGVLLSEGYGTQQIASHLMVNDGVVATLPLNRSFLVFGQRYIADSHVFSEVVYDRVRGRMMPSPLDAAFAALGNDQALSLLGGELGQYPGYAGALSGMRTLIDSHDEDFWDANLYNLWSSALRSLSAAPGADPAQQGMPTVTGTEGWGRRMLNAQLGSWAQLRHDTLLYAKQSYTGAPGCEYPDAYIEPYPKFFDAVERYAERGLELVEGLEAPADSSLSLREYFQNLATVSGTLEAMAEQQRTGTAHTADQLAFINDAVRVEQEDGGCVAIEIPDGWYASLFFNPEQSIQADPTIADVHTQPADVGGTTVGRVLHVGTALPRMMTVTVDTCAGPRAYAGLVYSYHEKVTENFQRLTDEQWAEEVRTGDPADVSWMQSLIAE